MSFLRRPSDPHAVPSVFPTFLQPSLPFRRKSRQSSTDSNTSTTSVFSAISSASTNTTSSNPFSRCPTPTPIPLQETEILAPTNKFLSGHNSHIHCAKCSTDLCLTSQIISKGFTGRHGRAYLVQGGPVPGQGPHSNSPVLPNTFLGKAVPRNLVTGQHTVSDVSCSICGTLLGWKYVGASEESQKYKVGKFILETKKIRIGVRWEGVDDEDGNGYENVVPLSMEALSRLGDNVIGNNQHNNNSNSGSRAKDRNALEFDSQDEDECEDLFAGVWSPQLAAKRRQRKKERMGRRAAKVSRATVPVSGSQESLA